jgi:hypothetical protein
MAADFSSGDTISFNTLTQHRRELEWEFDYN